MLPNINTLEKTTPKGTIVVFLEDWLERDKFGYSTYELTYICKYTSNASVKEIKSGHMYTKIHSKYLRIIN